MRRFIFIIGILILIFSGLFLRPVIVTAQESLGWIETAQCPYIGTTEYWHYATSTSEDLYHALYNVPSVNDYKHYIYHQSLINLAFQWSSVSDDHSWTVLSRGLTSFDTSSIGADDEIRSGRIKVKLSGLTNTAGLKLAMAFYPYTGTDTDYPFVFGDWGKLGYNTDPPYALTEPKNYDEAQEAQGAGEYLEFELTQAGINYIVAGGHTQMWLRFCFDGAGLSGMSKTKGGMVVYWIYESGTGLAPILELDYLRTMAPRDICDHSNESTGGSGDSITGISWLTPRCAFNDEQAGFRIEGTAGTNFTAQLIGSNDTVISEITDSIRTNSYYFWYPALDGYMGKFRCEVPAKSKVSTWGWSEAFKNAGSMRTFAMKLETEAVSWATDVDQYQVHVADTVMIWYWLSGIESAEISTTSLTIRQGGARTNDIYTSDLDDLASGYMECEDSCNYFMMASRYILASMGEVEDDLDGLIMNLDNPLVGVSKGYYYARIYKSGEGLLIPVSAYWYCEECNLTACPVVCDLAIYIIDAVYAEGDSIPVMILNDADLNFNNRFKNASLWVVDYTITPVTGVIDDSEYLINITRSAGATTLLLTISTTLDDYIHHSYLALTEEGGPPPVIPPIPGLPGSFGDWWDWVTGVFSGTSGHWLIMILAMGFVALIFYRKHRTVAIVLCFSIIGFGIVIGWIDIWLVVLLGIIAGIVIWRLVAGSHRQA